MRTRIVLAGLALALLLVPGPDAAAQSVVKLCTPIAGVYAQSCQDVTASNPLPTTATISGSVTVNSGATATATLPTLSAGAQAQQESLSGGLYVQPIDGTTIVSSSHGLPVDVVSSGVAQGSTTSGQTGSLVMGAVTTAAPSYTNAQTSPLSLDTSGNLRTTGTVAGSVTANAGTNLNTSALALDASVNGVLRAQGSTTSGETGPLIQGAVTTSAPSYTTAQTSPLSITTAGGLRVDGSAVTQPVSIAAQTTGGCTAYHLSGGSAANNNSTNIKNAAGTLCDLTVVNTTSALYYLKLYNSSSAPTCSSATGLVHVYPIPNGAGAGAGLQRSIGAYGEAYGTGISFCLTGGGGDTDNSNAATGVYIEASYK